MARSQFGSRNVLLDDKVLSNSVENVYESDFNFDDHEITDNELILSLSKKERKIKTTMNQIVRNTFELSKNLFEAREELAVYKSGTFYAWFENLGLKKDYVYRAIKKYELFLETNNLKVMDLSTRAIEFISKNRESVEVEVIEEIINSENPTEKIKEVKEDIKELEEPISDLEALERKEEKLEEKIRKTEIQLENLKSELETIKLQKTKI